MYEMIVAMNVTNPERYAKYREAMAPILAECGGGFRFDFVASEQLLPAPEHDVTRVFCITFADRDACARFFADKRYLQVKAEHYEGAVDGFTVVAEYALDV